MGPECGVTSWDYSLPSLFPTAPGSQNRWKDPAHRMSDYSSGGVSGADVCMLAATLLNIDGEAPCWPSLSLGRA